MPLREAISWLIDLAPRGIIEYVPKNDPMVQEILALRADVFTDYTEDNFDAALSMIARVVRSERITTNNRRLVWFDRT